MTELVVPLFDNSTFEQEVEMTLIALTLSAEHLQEAGQMADETRRYWWMKQAEQAFSENEAWLAERRIQYHYCHEAKRYILDNEKAIS